MQVTCEKCTAKYNIADDKIKSTGTSVKCPKCQAVFKVFPAAAEGETVACANCGKAAPAVPGMAVVFCEDCKKQLADAPPGGTDETDLFAGANLFGAAGAPAAPENDMFGDASPSAPAAGGLFDEETAKPQGGGLFDEAPAKPQGGDLFDEAPAKPQGGGLFDEAPAAPGGGGLFDDPPASPEGDDPFGASPAAPPAAASGGGGLFDDDAAPSGGGGGGLFDDEVPSAAPSGGGGLFDDEPAGGSSGGGLFDDEAAPAAAADPFGDFDAPPGAALPAAASDPFAEFGDSGNDDMGFQEPASAESSPETDFGDPDTEMAGDDDAMSGPVREKEAPKFKKKDLTPKDRLIDFFAENSAKIGMIGGGSAFLGVLLLVGAMALLPSAFNARPTRPDDIPGFLSRNAFGLQKTLKTKFYGQAMEEAYLKAGTRSTLSWSGQGFASAEKEYRELLVFDPNNQKAKAALVELFAKWDLVEENRDHKSEMEKMIPGAGTLPDETLAQIAYLDANVGELNAIVPKLGDKEKLYAGMAKKAAGDITGATQDLTLYASGARGDFLGEMVLAAALRDTKSYGLAVTHFEKAGASVKGHAKASLEIGKIQYSALSDNDRAVKAFESVMTPPLGASNKLKAEAQYYLAHILHRRGRGPQALASIQAALAIDGANPTYLTTLGDLQFDSGKIVDAFTAYEKAIKIDKKYVDALIGLGRANERLEKRPAALEHYQQAISADPVNIRANFLYAGLILSEGRKDEAERVLRAVLERDPDNVEALAQLAKFYVDQGQSAKALIEYSKIIEIAPGKYEGYVGMGAVLLEQGKVAEAKQRFQQAATLATNNPSVMFRLGQAAYLEGDTKTAAESLQQALGKDPYHWEAHLYMGMTYRRLGEYENALKEYQKTIDVNLRGAEAYRQRGLVYLEQGRLLEGNPASVLLDKAVAQLEQALYYEPNNAEYHFDYGVCLNAAGKAGKAKDAWLKAKELRPNYQEAMFALAQYYVFFTDYSNAESILKEVLRNSPKDGRAYLEMGKVYLARELLDEAQRAFSKANQFNGKLAEAQNLMGEVYERKGLSNESTAYFKKALAIDSKYGIAYFNLGLYWKDRDQKKSKEMFKAALETKTLTKEKAEDVQTFLRELEFIK